jgi:pullulanase
MADILKRRASKFVAWVPPAQAQPPSLIVGQLKPGNPPTLTNTKTVPFVPSPLSGLFDLDPATCGLVDGQTYHYWIQVDDSRSTAVPPARIAVTDPFATSVDWRLFPPAASDCTQPAAVTRWAGGMLVDGDPNGETASLAGEPSARTLPTNAQLVIYELPTAWTMSRALNAPELGVGTFRDVAALVDPTVTGANFVELDLLAAGQAHLTDLGVNALELLPCADSFFKREWGYDTSHYLAPDAELGWPEGNLSPTANQDLADLVVRCHRQGIRFFIDVVMAFGKEDSYGHIDAADFHIDDPSKALPGDPDAFTSTRAGGSVTLRDGFGSTLWRYATSVTTYDPISGLVQPIFPARQLMLAFVTRWMSDFHVDGVRMDSVENVANWDFVGTFKQSVRDQFHTRWTAEGLPDGPEADARVLVVGEELSLPFALLAQGRLDGLWNEDFQGRIRAALWGENVDGEPTFEWTVKKAIDCRLLSQAPNGFGDLSQAILYLTKHDVEGPRHERLFTMFQSLPTDQTEKRIKLGFVCLLTALGIPMILAGEEFADQHDLFDSKGAVTQNGGKQIDPVNFSRLTTTNTDPNDPDAVLAPMRRRIFAYVRTLVRFRTSAPALAVNDTAFIHQDFDDGKRVMAWVRGSAGMAPVVVVANFSDFASAPGAGYVVHNWPAAPTGQVWVEITQGRAVAIDQIGGEPIFPWEAKVYTLHQA